LISLKRYLESDYSGLLKSALESYRAALSATGSFGSSACPCLGNEFEQSLWGLQHALEEEATPESLAQTEQRFETELKQASTSAAEFFKQKAEEIKELMIVLARATEAVGERDQRYTQQFRDFSARLETLADLNDLTKIRASLVQSARDLKDCVDQMAHDSEESVKALRSEISGYQAKLVETERLAARDALTGLGNRRRIEYELEQLEQSRKIFWLMLFDVNCLKQVNDSMGHPAGDQVLKQFAIELQAAFRPNGVVGRWGGDEFIAILVCTAKEHESVVARVRKWVFGDYSIEVRGATQKVHVTAAIGSAVSNPGEKYAKVIERADAEMYRDKSATARK